MKAYYAYRVYILSGRLYISMISWSVSLLEIGGSLTVTVLLQQYGPVIYGQRFVWLSTATIACDVFIDVLNTTALCYWLHRLRSGIVK